MSPRGRHEIVRSPRVPLLLSLRDAITPAWGEEWRRFRERAADRLEGARERVATTLGLELVPLLAAGGLAGRIPAEQLGEITRGALGPELTRVAWDHPVAAQAMAYGDASIGPGTPASVVTTTWGDGAHVAILDSGIDRRHPFLAVSAAVSTCPERSSRAGRHGTHCAGIVASRSDERPGVAPGVRLSSIKVARASGTVDPGWLAKGIDAAMDLGADVLSISCGLNHLPASERGGHGWSCPHGTCLLCRAVDCATACGAMVVAAAGNLGSYARVRRRGHGGAPPVDELLCPAQARGAIAVGALDLGPTTRRWRASSSGRTPYGRRKPELLAPGVDVTSTVPTTDGGGDLSELGLFGDGTGTSVATAMVAGAVALLVARCARTGGSRSPDVVRRQLLESCSRRARIDGASQRILDLPRLRAFAAPPLPLSP